MAKSSIPHAPSIPTPKVARPGFSITTPHLDQMNWLELCHASIADQEGVETTHIIQDASLSPDLRVWAEKQRGIELHQERDEGMYDALNKGLATSSREICCWLNADEQYLPGALQAVAQVFAEDPGLDILFCDAILVTAEGRPASYRRAVLPSRFHIRSSHLNTLSCATFFRRTVVDQGPKFDTRWKTIGDAVWIYHLIGAGFKMRSLKIPTSVYTFTGSNLSADARARRESQEWRQSGGISTRLTKWSARIHHWIRKAIAGAYHPRSVNVALYTLSSPTQRVVFSQQRLPTGWPRDVEAAPLPGAGSS